MKNISYFTYSRHIYRFNDNGVNGLYKALFIFNYGLNCLKSGIVSSLEELLRYY